MSRRDDFRLIEEQEAENESRSLIWLAVVVALVAFGLALAIALFTLTSRMRGPSAADNAPTQSPTALGPTAVAGVVTNSATPAPQASPPPSATVTPAATATPLPTATLTPVCGYAVDGGLAPMVGNSGLGCPVSEPGRIVWAAWEPFERGSMVWRSDTDQAYVFDNGGGWSVVDERWSGESQPDRGTPPPGLIAPERGFGYVWATSDALFSRLGWATDVEKGFCARVQDFENGFALKSEPVPSCTADNLYNHAAEAGWQPLSWVGHTNGNWR